jgi:hypothetical protein
MWISKFPVMLPVDQTVMKNSCIRFVFSQKYLKNKSHQKAKGCFGEKIRSPGTIENIFFDHMFLFEQPVRVEV